jgi:hypothetical protein
MANDVTLFYPKTGRDLRIQYPELMKIHEFKKLRSASQMLFVWYWSNPTSPVSPEMPFKKRLELCLKESGWKPDGATIKLLQEDLWPEDLKVACDRMEKFETNLRNQARKVYKEIFANFEKLAKVKDSDFQLVDKEGNNLGIDFAARNQYVTYATRIAQEMPDIIKKMEEGFGTDEASTETGSNEKAIELWHKARQ